MKKLLTMAIAIDTGAVKPSTVYNDTGTYNVQGTDIYNWDRGAWGPQSMVGCLQHSLNTCMAYITDLVGVEKFYDYLDKFGLGKPTNIELAQEDYYPLSKPGSSMWSQITLSTNSFGQGLMATPIQMVQAISALANDGVMMQPHIVREIRYNGHVEKIEPTEVGRPISAETARTVTEADVRSVTSGQAQDRIFDLIRAAGRGDRDRAMAVYTDLRALETPPQVILSLMIRQYTLLIQVRELMDRGFQAKEIALAVHSPEFAVTKGYIPMVRGLARRDLERSLDLCVGADASYKSGKISDRLAVEVLIAGQMCGGPGGEV